MICKKCPPPDCSCPPVPCTRCDKCRDNNMWVERACQPGNTAPGICLLDTMTDDQIVHMLERNPFSAKDLIRVTTDPHLLYLARTVKMLTTIYDTDEEQKHYNRNTEAGSLPFYGYFKGQPPAAQPTDNVHALADGTIDLRLTATVEPEGEPSKDDGSGNC